MNTTAALDLILPARCVGCSSPGASLCRRCTAAAVRPRRHRPDPCPPGLPPLWAAGDYRDVLRQAVLAFKERNQRGLAAPLGAVLAAAVKGAVTSAPASGATGAVVGDGSCGRRPAAVVLVPVPSRRRAARLRGGDHMLRLARLAAAVLAADGLPATVVPALALTGRPRDSAGLSAAERAVNLSGAFTLRAGAPGAPGAPGGPGGPGGVGGRGGVGWPARGSPRPAVVAVDDVVTTGTTLAEVARAFAVAAMPVPLAAVVAAAGRADPPAAVR